MVSPRKKIRKSGNGDAAAAMQSEPVEKSNVDIPMDEDVDSAALYEDEEGKLMLQMWNVLRLFIKLFENHGCAGGYRVGDIYIPPPVKAYCSSESQGARLIITEIMNTNFKSYAGDVSLGPFCHVIT